MAAVLLAERGPHALSARQIATKAGSSTMALYTHFGGMGGLVREMVHDGYTRLRSDLAKVRRTGDPVVDLVRLARVYRANALANARLYAVMFGACTPAGFSLTEEDRRHIESIVDDIARYVARCVAAGRFRPGDPALTAHQLWTAIHGLVSLELGRFLTGPCDATRCFEAQLIGLLVGAGDSLAAAARSVALSHESR